MDDKSEESTEEDNVIGEGRLHEILAGQNQHVTTNGKTLTAVFLYLRHHAGYDFALVCWLFCLYMSRNTEKVFTKFLKAFYIRITTLSRQVANSNHVTNELLRNFTCRFSGQKWWPYMSMADKNIDSTWLCRSSYGGW